MPNIISLASTYSRSTITGLRQRIDHEFVAPQTLTRGQFNELTSHEQREYDDARLEYFGAGAWLPTREFRMLMRIVRGSLRTTHPMGTGERGIVLTGPAHIGKSTNAMQLHRAVEGLVSERLPDFRARGIVPTVHIDIQPRSTPKSIAYHILDFFETPYSTRRSQTELISTAIRLLQAHSTRVLVFDEFQMLKLDGKTGDDAINTIKTIMNEAGALCVFSGIDLMRRLSSPAAQQLMRRCQVIRVNPLAGNTPEERTEWDRMVSFFSQEMRLLDADPDHLMPHSDTLRTATGGSIGNLRRLLSMAMESAIHDRRDKGVEEIDKGLLEEVAFFDASQVLAAA